MLPESSPPQKLKRSLRLFLAVLNGLGVTISLGSAGYLGCLSICYPSGSSCLS